MRKKILLGISIVLIIGIGSYLYLKNLNNVKLKEEIIELIENGKFSSATNKISSLTENEKNFIEDDVLDRLVIIIRDDYNKAEIDNSRSALTISKQLSVESTDWRSEIFQQVPKLLAVYSVTESDDNVCNELNSSFTDNVTTLATDAFNDLVDYYNYGYGFYADYAKSSINKLYNLEPKSCTSSFDYSSFKWDIYSALASAYNNTSYSNLTKQLTNYQNELKIYLSFNEDLLSEIQSVAKDMESIDAVFSKNSSNFSSIILN